VSSVEYKRLHLTPVRKKPL